MSPVRFDHEGLAATVLVSPRPFEASTDREGSHKRRVGAAEVEPSSTIALTGCTAAGSGTQLPRSRPEESVSELAAPPAAVGTEVIDR
jgi:hypothetical protein